jgi:hypothetical protein
MALIAEAVGPVPVNAMVMLVPCVHLQEELMYARLSDTVARTATLQRRKSRLATAEVARTAEQFAFAAEEKC